MKLLILLFFIGLVGCSEKPNPRPEHKIIIERNGLVTSVSYYLILGDKEILEGHNYENSSYGMEEARKDGWGIK